MVAASTQNADRRATADPGAKKNLQNLEKVRAIFASLAKYIHATTIYTANNPNVAKFTDVFHDTFRIYFQKETELTLEIQQYTITWRGETVYSNTDKSASIAFLLFKDGVGEISILPTVKPNELDQFADLIKTEIYNPPAHLDIVSRLWQAEFKDIQYRVFDESADGSTGEGGTSGAASQEQPLKVNDFRNAEVPEDSGKEPDRGNDNPFRSLGSYFNKIAERGAPTASPAEREKYLENILDSTFTVSSAELEAWREEFVSSNDQDRLLWLLDIMLDFTQRRSSAPVTRDILDVIDRVVRFIIAEARIPVLIALLRVQQKMEQSRETVVDFQSLPERIRRELMSPAFLLALGKDAARSREDAREVLDYFHLLGASAIPGICELMSNSKDPLVHKDACDTLISISPDDALSIAGNFNLDNPHEAKSAVYIVRKICPGEIPSLITQLMSSEDPLVRKHVVDHLSQVGNDEAATLLCTLLDDTNSGVRIRTLAAVETVQHPAVIDKVSALCFDVDHSDRDTDELERMFRTLGALAANGTPARLAEMTRKKGWGPFGRSKGKQDKLLAITALRYIPGAESLELLKALARDRDSLVRTKAAYMIKQRGSGDEVGDDEPVLVGSEKEEDV